MHAKSAQPKGLYYLFFTELWERFGFYTVQTLLVLYLSKALHYSDDKAYLIYGTFSSMIYLTPVIGGYLADKVLGFQKAVVLGGLLYILGYIFTSIPSTELLFFIGLGILIVSNGFFKANVSSLLGELYGPNDPRREGGFTIFYMGINIGGLIPPLITGYIATVYGWHAGFSVAIVGLIIGVITFIVGRSKFKKAGLMPASSPLLKARKKTPVTWMFIIGTIIAIGLFYLLFQVPRDSNLILVGATIIFTVIMVYLLFKEKKDARNKMLACLILILISVGFWSLYVQTFTSMMLFADRNMSKDFLGFTIDAQFTQFFNPFFIILLSPFFSRLWLKLDENRINPSIPSKFTLGFFYGPGILSAGLRDQIFQPRWRDLTLVASDAYFLETCGELLLSPIGLAMVTRLSPRHLRGMMMGMWFLILSVSFALGGGLATLSSVAKGDRHAGSQRHLRACVPNFRLYWAWMTLVALLCVPYLKRLISHQKDTTADVEVR